MLTQQEETKARNDIERFKALERLMVNSDFRTVILEGYLREYPLELLYLISAIDNKTDQHNRLDAVGYFKQYLDQVQSAAESAEELLIEANQER